MDIPYIVKFLAVFASTAVGDVCWTYYFLSISQEKALKAGWWGTLVIAFGAVATVSYVHDNSLLVAALIGAFVGTSLTVRFNKGKK